LTCWSGLPSWVVNIRARDRPRFPGRRRPRSVRLPRDIFRYFVGIRIGGVVRCQHDLRMRPEPAVRGQRLGCINIERGGSQRPVVKAFQNVGFVLQAATAGIDQYRCRHRALAVELLEQSAIEDVPRVRCERKQANQDIGRVEECIELRSAMKVLNAVDVPLASAPAAGPKAEMAQRLRRAYAERAEPHDTDRNRARGPLKFRSPASIALAGSEVKLLPMMHQDVQHDILRHPSRKVGNCDTHHRHLRQACIGHQRVDTRTQIENDAKVWKRREFSRRGLPDRGIVHLSGIEFRVGRQHHAASAADIVEAALPSFG
jgi:hypothetical protein